MTNKQNYKEGEKVYFFCQEETVILLGEIERIDNFSGRIVYQVKDLESGRPYLISEECYMHCDVTKVSNGVMCHMLRKIWGTEND